MKKVLLQNLADGKWGQLLLVTIGYFLLFKTDKIPEIAIHHLTHFGAKPSYPVRLISPQNSPSLASLPKLAYYAKYPIAL
ncbi:TPA: hypothetical protein I7715_08295 [Vibrio vulnificus]|nr:hypothetical protein [Vibrio vulnificus]